MALATKNQKKLRQAAGIFGLIQGFAWMTMSVISLIVSYKSPQINLSEDLYKERIGHLMYAMLLDTSTEIEFSGKFLHAAGFVAFVWIYLVMDVAWMLASLAVMYKRNDSLAKFQRIWSGVTALICILDVILVAILAANYNKCITTQQIPADEVFEKFGWGEVCANGLLPALVIGAKGFLLWFVNVGLAWKVFSTLVKRDAISREMDVIISKNQNRLKQIAGILGLVQGLIWAAASITCIIIFDKTDLSQVDFSKESYQTRLGQLIYLMLLDPSSNEIEFTGKLLPASTFIVVVWLHLVLHVGWILVSLIVLFPQKRLLVRLLKIWGGSTAFICLIDFILTAVLGSVYGNCTHDFHQDTRFDSFGWGEACASGTIPVMVIVAKGFLLWLVNAAVAWKIYRMGITIKKRRRSETLRPSMVRHT